ncbi:MAG: MBL fold metallo-hydrolase [Chloroflexota bacterium]
MPKFICATCGTQFPESDEPPAHCPICEDERQYVGANGQQWTTLENLLPDHHTVIEQVEPHLYRIKPEPKVGIGQYAFLVQTPNGNILWDCVPFIDNAVVAAIIALGGIKAIAISHPHYHTVMNEWSKAFNDAPIYIHEGNRRNVVDDSPAIVYWQGETQPLVDGVMVVHNGGHYEGSTVLHWRDGAEGRGVLLVGDTLVVVQDTRWVSFMWSYPNLIPLPPSKIRRIVQSLEPFAYDRLYEAFGRVMDSGGKASVRASAERYIRAMSE